ncbi:hypothetical protein BK654_23630 [Pseudomonas brassicacearum]|nr:hypothetical protein BK654_23630 [Pseudomonas brassicacearum]
MWLSHRYREQARSHMGLWVLIASAHDTKTCGSELARDEASPFNIFIASDTAFASKLAPTGGTRSHPNQAGYQAASRRTLISAPR